MGWEELWRGWLLLYISLLICSFEIASGEDASTTTEKPECIHEPQAGEMFTSTNFPAPYEKNTNCTYRMEANRGKRVKLTFYLFDTESNPYCGYDSVTIFDSDDSLIHKYCGKNTQNLQVISKAETLKFIFKTDHVEEKMGFLASWEEVADKEEKVDTGGKYFIAFPRSFIEESAEKICVELFDSDRKDGTIETQVFINNKKEKKNWLFDESSVMTKEVNI